LPPGGLERDVGKLLVMDRARANGFYFEWKAELGGDVILIFSEDGQSSAADVAQADDADIYWLHKYGAVLIRWCSLGLPLLYDETEVEDQDQGFGSQADFIEAEGSQLLLIALVRLFEDPAGLIA